MKNLFIVIKKKYLLQIISGEKVEELRIVSPYWVNKLVDKSYDKVTFQAGYRKDSLKHEVPYYGYSVRNIKHEFFGSEAVPVFAIKLTSN